MIKKTVGKRNQKDVGNQCQICKEKDCFGQCKYWHDSSGGIVEKYPVMNKKYFEHKREKEEGQLQRGEGGTSRQNSGLSRES